MNYTDPIFLAEACQVAYDGLNSQTATDFIAKYNVKLDYLSNFNVFAIMIDDKVLAFRGSEIPKTKNGIFDWLEDLNAVPNSHGIHSGFYQAASSIMDLIPDTIEILTGHSLGGAIAATIWRINKKFHITDVIVFGCPRITNVTYDNIIAYANHDDPVPHLPLFYSFVGKRIDIGTHNPNIVFDPVSAIEQHLIKSYIPLLNKE